MQHVANAIRREFIKFKRMAVQQNGKDAMDVEVFLRLFAESKIKNKKQNTEDAENVALNYRNAA